MRLFIDKLGKVAVTVEQSYWSRNKDYDKLTIVQTEGEFATHISRKPVPAGTELTNREYWIPFSSLKESIVLDYNSFIAKYDKILKEHGDNITNLQNRVEVLETLRCTIKRLISSTSELIGRTNEMLSQEQVMIQKANDSIARANQATIAANDATSNALLATQAANKATDDANALNKKSNCILKKVNALKAESEENLAKSKDLYNNSVIYLNLANELKETILLIKEDVDSKTEIINENLEQIDALENRVELELNIINNKIEELRSNINQIETNTTDISILATHVGDLSKNKVDKIEGKGLSTEDFTTLLKEKLEGLENYNDAELRGKIEQLITNFNILLDSNPDQAINSFNEIIAFLNNIQDTETLEGIISGINSKLIELENVGNDNAMDIHNMQNSINTINDTTIPTIQSDIETLREDLVNDGIHLQDVKYVVEDIDVEYYKTNNDIDVIYFKRLSIRNITDNKNLYVIASTINPIITGEKDTDKTYYFKVDRIDKTNFTLSIVNSTDTDNHFIKIVGFHNGKINSIGTLFNSQIHNAIRDYANKKIIDINHLVQTVTTTENENGTFENTFVQVELNSLADAILILKNYYLNSAHPYDTLKQGDLIYFKNKSDGSFNYYSYIGDGTSYTEDDFGELGGKSKFNYSLTKGNYIKLSLPTDNITVKTIGEHIISYCNKDYFDNIDDANKFLKTTFIQKINDNVTIYFRYTGDPITINQFNKIEDFNFSSVYWSIDMLYLEYTLTTIKTDSFINLYFPFGFITNIDKNVDWITIKNSELNLKLLNNITIKINNPILKYGVNQPFVYDSTKNIIISDSKNYEVIKSRPFVPTGGDLTIGIRIKEVPTSINISSLSSTEYDAITTKDANTFYIVDEVAEA